MIESLLYTLALCLTGGMAAVFFGKYQKEREKNRELMEKQKFNSNPQISESNSQS